MGPSLDLGGDYGLAQNELVQLLQGGLERRHLQRIRHTANCICHSVQSLANSTKRHLVFLFRGDAAPNAGTQAISL